MDESTDPDVRVVAPVESAGLPHLKKIKDSRVIEPYNHS